MTALNVQGVITRVQRQFGDESGVQITDDDIIRWINDAQREVTMQHENLHQTTSKLSSVAGQYSYALPANLFTLQSVEYRDSNDTTRSFYALRFLSAKAMSEYLDGWKGSDYSSDVPRYFARGETSGTFTIWPKPDASYVDNIQLTYSRYSVDIVDVNSTIDVPEYYHPFILEYCLMKAYEMDEDWEAADRKAAYVQSTIDFNNNRESWFGRETYPSVVPISEDYI